MVSDVELLVKKLRATMFSFLLTMISTVANHDFNSDNHNFNKKHVENMVMRCQNYCHDHDFNKKGVENMVRRVEIMVVCVEIMVLNVENMVSESFLTMISTWLTMISTKLTIFSTYATMISTGMSLSLLSKKESPPLFRGGQKAFSKVQKIMRQGRF